MYDLTKKIEVAPIIKKAANTNMIFFSILLKNEIIIQPNQITKAILSTFEIDILQSTNIMTIKTIKAKTSFLFILFNISKNKIAKQYKVSSTREKNQRNEIFFRRKIYFNFRIY